MKEDVVAANLANLRQSINELKECIKKQNTTVPKVEQSVKADSNEKAIYTGIAKSFCTCWNEALSVIKKHIWQQQPNTLPFSLWFPKLIDLFKQKSRLLEYLYRHVCDYNQNRMTIETNTRCILKRQDEILEKINELKSPVTVIPSSISGLFIYGYHIKLRYVMVFIVAIVTWAVVASASSMKYKEESFAYYSMYRAVKEQSGFILQRMEELTTKK
ncbi:hypothetical protein HMPREF1981_00460 [Bacteroides pyogenes F0041]|uniref:Uncharacterized protein n=1 Tax=Bacteroides pyogenes F0041 TaxID=1321819 RepID=U2CDV0_9BACE|nr:hypothetical protein [Bacteroides pyogenes]GAE22847.1 hypothetical protein JCM10003_2508 [Bacteroides pyogenes JCM 10003]ERI88679.1 hypothetical protein HMPREF1981_00460 [Bacteroides pyogenes F0041]MBB3895681.1 hypothetical protein [Bacteroides pyogenes]SUV33513.1 Uncharacterised protein [Bacteroides pyogenes]SUV70715.1 Uncharacterised protein [Bacteroides pyogenes]